MEARISDLTNSMVQGDLRKFDDNSIVIGKDLADSLGVFVGSRVRVITANTTMSVIGGIPSSRGFDVVAIFQTGFNDYDSRWVYVPLSTAQSLLGYGDIVSTIEVKVRDMDRAAEVGQRILQTTGDRLNATDWTQLHRSIFQALQLDRLIAFITIGLIVIVAALNVVATLIMLVLEKARDIAVLMSMGATKRQIRKIFIYQGLIIGMLGTSSGLIIGHALSYFADRYRLVSLDPESYMIAFVPFKANLPDSVFIASAALLISFLATLYPSSAAAKLQPVEALRYE
jgi:lipoprotein-releasing system permease protein